MNLLQVIGKRKIAGYEFTGIEGGFGEGKKAMLVKEVAEIHGQPLKEINRRIHDNIERFKNCVDIIDLLGVGLSHTEIMSFGFTQQAINSYIGLKNKGLRSGIYILSERGYAKLLKILEDDTAWELYDQFVDEYFNMRGQQIPTDPFKQIEMIANGTINLNNRVTSLEKTVEEQLTLDYKQQRFIQNEINSKVSFIWNNWIDFVDCIGRRATKGKIFAKIYKRLKDRYKCGSYKDIRKKDFDAAVSYVRDWRGE